MAEPVNIYIESMRLRAVQCQAAAEIAGALGEVVSMITQAGKKGDEGQLLFANQIMDAVNQSSLTYAVELRAIIKDMRRELDV